MGSKLLKGIVLKGTGAVPVADAEAFRQAKQNVRARMQQNPTWMETWRRFGSGQDIELVSELGPAAHPQLEQRRVRPGGGHRPCPQLRPVPSQGRPLRPLLLQHVRPGDHPGRRARTRAPTVMARNTRPCIVRVQLRGAGVRRHRGGRGHLRSPGAGYHVRWRGRGLRHGVLPARPADPGGVRRSGPALRQCRGHGGVGPQHRGGRGPGQAPEPGRAGGQPDDSRQPRVRHARQGHGTGRAGEPGRLGAVAAIPAEQPGRLPPCLWAAGPGRGSAGNWRAGGGQGRAGQAAGQRAHHLRLRGHVHVSVRHSGGGCARWR